MGSEMCIRDSVTYKRYMEGFGDAVRALDPGAGVTITEMVTG